MEIFFPVGNLSYEEFIQWQSISSAFICNYSLLYHIWYRSSLVTECCSVFRFTQSQTQRQVFTLCCPSQFSYMHILGPPAFAVSLKTLQREFNPDQALHIGPGQDPNCLTFWWYS